MQTRREFIVTASQTAAVLAGLPLVKRAIANDRVRKPLDIIDCHTHFYDPSRAEGVPWPDEQSSLYRTVLPKHLRALPMPQPLGGTVIVEASNWIEDNQWLLDLAKDDPFIVGIVGHLTPGNETFREHLKRFAANELFRGIRVSQQLIAKVDEQLLADLKLLVDHDLELDVNGGPETPQIVASLAARLPELRIVVNHLGNVRIDGKWPPQDWTDGMRQAARHKQVYCKISALVEGAARDDKPAPKEVDFYRPVLDIAWEAFGEDRLIYGSNWPVSERAADYAVLQQIVLDYFADRGEVAVEKFFSLNAKQAYKWLDREGRTSRSDGQEK